MGGIPFSATGMTPCWPRPGRVSVAARERPCEFQRSLPAAAAAAAAAVVRVPSDCPCRPAVGLVRCAHRPRSLWIPSRPRIASLDAGGGGKGVARGSTGGRQFRGCTSSQRGRGAVGGGGGLIRAWAKSESSVWLGRH